MIKNNKSLWKSVKKIIPGGNHLISKRPSLYSKNWPVFYQKALGCKIKDLEGRYYYDFSRMAVGCCTLGYSNKEVNNFVKKTINNSNQTSLNSPLEYQLSSRLLQIEKWSGFVKFAKTGADINSIAIRIARAYTNKNIVLICGYHGWSDWYISLAHNSKKNLNKFLLPNISKLGVPAEFSKYSKSFKYNDIDSFKKLIKKYRNNIAAVIMEPEREERPQEDFLNKIRSICTKNKIILIFDEITSGFRTNFGGHYNLLNVRPDMVTYGKAIANGYPITILLGKKKYSKVAEKSFISSTQWSENIGVAAAIKTLDIMERNKVQNKLVAIGEEIKKIWLENSKKYNVDITISGLGPVLKLQFKKNNKYYMEQFTEIMLKKGFLTGTYFYSSICHMPRLINKYRNAIDETFYKLMNLKK
jgi:glutamate-1-semialdehyde aminotransferase